VDVKKPPHQFHNDLDKANYELCKLGYQWPFWILQNAVSDEPGVFKDAPITIQVIGRTLEEESVIRLGEIVDDALKTKTHVSKL
jgi:amidase